MTKRSLTPDYRAGAKAFTSLFNGFRHHGPDCIYFHQIAAGLADATHGKSDEFRLGFIEALAVLIEETATGSVREDWSPMHDLEDPDWWREDESAGGCRG